MSNLLQSNLGFGLKLEGVGNTGLLAPLPILDPQFRQVQAERDWHTRLFGSNRETYRNPTIILLANLTAILPRHSYRFTSLFGEPGVVHHPSYYWIPAQHRG